MSRLGKVKPVGGRFFVATDGIHGCGHQHSSSRAAKACAANIKKGERVTPGTNLYVKTYLYTGNPEVGFEEVPE